MTKKIETNLAHLERLSSLVRENQLKSAVLIWEDEKGNSEFIRFNKGIDPVKMIGYLEWQKMLIAATELNGANYGEDNFELTKR